MPRLHAQHRLDRDTVPYWFQALRRDLEIGEAYGKKGGSGGSVAGNHFNTERFGFSCYPAFYPAGGKVAFNVNENNTSFKKQLLKHVQPVRGQDFGDPDVCDWPTEATLKSFWAKYQ